MSAIDPVSNDRLAALLRGEDGTTAAERRLAGVIASLRATPPRAPERLRERVLALEPRRTWLPRRRTLLLLAPACAAAAVGAAVVHGLVSSGSRTAQEPPSSVAVERAAAPKTAQAGAATSGADKALTQTAPSVGSGRLTHYEASLEVRVPNDKLSSATGEATRIVRGLGGYAASVVYRTPSAGPGEAYLELRVPASKVQTAIARLSGLGALVSQQLSARDLQRDLERQSAQIDQLRRFIVRAQAALRDPSLPAAQKIELQLKLADAKRALAQRRHARNNTVASGTLARISLVLSTAKRHAVVAPHRSDRLDRMLGSAVSFLGLEAVVALYALIVISPLVPLVALVWGATWARRRRDERRLVGA
jgi:hypothetical protein